MFYACTNRKTPEGKGAVIGGVSKQSQTGRSRQPPSQQQAHTRAFLRCNCALSENSTAFVCEQRSRTCCVRAGQDPVCPMCRVQKSCYDRQGGQPVENIYYKYTLCTRPKRRGEEWLAAAMVGYDESVLGKMKIQTCLDARASTFGGIVSQLETKTGL